MEIRSFEYLEVWQKAKELTIKSYGLTASFSKDEIFGITSQIKRVVLSIPANIAEGFGRFHYLDKAKFYLNARGSILQLKKRL
ncbi:MAG: four helix bundle protein [Thermodesulfovibrionales bacterium]